MLKKRITWLALGLIAALGVTVAAAPPQNLIPVYLWLSGQAVSASNPVPAALTVSEQTDTASAIVVGASSTPVVSGECGAYECTTLFCALRNDNTANDRTINAWAFRFAPKDLTAGNLPAGYTQASLSAPKGRIIEAYTGTAASTDLTPDTTLDELKYLVLTVDMRGVGNYEISATASGAGATITGVCKKSR